MKDDTTATVAPTGAIDWAKDSHAGAVVDHDGRLIARYEFSHTAAGLTTMLRRFARHGVERIAKNGPTGRWSRPCSRVGSRCS
jgi:hypothetical protein